MYCHLKSYSVLWNHETSCNHNILFSISLSVSFCMFLCSKGHFIRAYLDTIQMTLVQMIWEVRKVRKIREVREVLELSLVSFLESNFGSQGLPWSARWQLTSHKVYHLILFFMFSRNQFVIGKQEGDSVWRPVLEFENMLKYEKTKVYGDSSTFSLWYMGNQTLQYSEEIKVR